MGTCSQLWLMLYKLPMVKRIFVAISSQVKPNMADCMGVYYHFTSR